MPIGIDYTPAYEQGGGIGRYVRELVAALAAHDSAQTYHLFVGGARQNKLPPAPAPNFRYRSTRLSPLTLARLWHRARLPLPVELFVGKVRLFHATDFVLPPTLPRTRTLLTVHDLSFARLPDSAAPSLRAYLEAVVPRSARRADHILADSAATKADLIALYGIPESKITVLYSGVSEAFKPTHDSAIQSAVRAKYGIGESPYVLSVGTVQPRKNYERLMQAFAALPTRWADLKLVIVGGRGWLDSPIYAQARALGERVLLTGFAEESDLPALYSGALCLAFPSLYEGFGLPVLEGMACGVPVLTSNVSSLPEVAGDAALMIDPHSVEAIRAGLIELLEEDSAAHAARIERGYAQAKRFTWHAAAQQLKALYERLI
ncbi:MAG: glycosyltransferase family 1 protein [Candidatus Thermofonsia Clade 1 bacterium]|uniref:Glycosyltransferase family 1 protein n=1 Tax=Candidatus Thermofonsia Clade 1 bacterium TaxID=2364210 RepID=A0A2M8P1W6_9CHLR|nr:MAG: glycosyltransferase family 1 protein [Candidatus Thermofonsia Clade 1 bacterium]